MSATRVRTKVLSSSISTRSTPSIPSSSHLYDPQAKSILRYRLTTKVLPYSLAFSWLVSVCWSTWMHGGPETLGAGGILINAASPATWVLVLSGWVGVVLPAMALRKTYFAVPRSSAASPALTLKNAWAQRSSVHCLSAYAGSVLFTAVIHTLVARACETSDPRLSLFVKSKKHPYYLNGRFVFLIFSQLILSILILVRTILLDQLPFQYRPLSLRTTQVILTSPLIAILTVLSSSLLFASARIILPIFLRLPLISILLRPFAAHFTRGAYTLLLPLHHAGLLVRSFWLSLSTLLTLEVTSALFDASSSLPILTSSSGPFPLTALSGITSQNPIFTFFAFSELRDLARAEGTKEAAIREELFADTKYTPGMWAHIVKTGLTILGEDYQVLLERGKPYVKPVAPAPTPAVSSVGVSTPSRVVGTPLKLIREPIMKSSAGSPNLNEESSTIPALFRSSLPAQTSASAPALIHSIQQLPVLGAQLYARAEKWVYAHLKAGWEYAPSEVRTVLERTRVWYGRERVGKTVEGWVPRRELDVTIIETLSSLVCASLREDKYGIVQKDIPRVLEAFLSFLGAVEGAQVELNEKFGRGESEIGDEKEVGKAYEALAIVGDALKTGISSIVNTFGDRLVAYRFPPLTARKLQGFVDYRA